MFKNRRLVRLSCMLAILGLLASCGGGDATSPPPQPTATTVAAAEPTAASEEPTAVSEEPTAASEEPTAEPPTDATPKADLGIGASGEGSVETSGTYIADLGFRPDYNGFSFPNYGGDAGAINLTAVEVRRLFGDQVCASLEGDTCILTPAGEQWMEAMNSSMGGGHCEGMAVLSNLLYTNRVDLGTLGAASAPDLEIAGNDALQREIALWFTTQATQPARAGIVQQTPSGVVNTLINAFAAGPSGSETYAVGFYKRDRSGGHAVTPYAVEDRGNGVYWIMIYDNNYPKAARAIEVDTNADTWRYSGSTNPSEPADDYEGDASTVTLELAPIEPRLTSQLCPFCEGSADAGGASRGSVGGGTGAVSGTEALSDTVAMNEVWLEGAGDLLITDLEGRSIGFKDGQFVNEIPGASSNTNKFGVDVWDVDKEPVYYLPRDIDFTINIDGSRLTEPTSTTVTFIGPGYVLEATDIMLDPGQVDTLDVTPDGSFLSYRSEGTETPLLLVGVETDESDYLFEVQGYELEAGEALNLALDLKEGTLSLDSIDNTAPGKYSLYMAKYDDKGEQVFGGDDIGLEPNDIVYVDYLKWPGNGQPMELDLDRGSDGSVDESLQVEDVSDAVVETDN